MKNSCIIAGGTFHKEVFLDFLNNKKVNKEKPFIVAADKGAKYLFEINVMPDVIIGDFDSVGSEFFDKIKEIENSNKAVVVRLKPEKDNTDTEAALDYILKEDRVKKGRIYIFAGTGTRIDHVYANIHILLKAKKYGYSAFLIDDKMKIRILNQDDKFTLKKEEQYGKFVSIFALSEVVRGINLKGFKYNLSDYTLHIGTSLGESNEIEKDEATISFKQGLLLVMESMD